MPAEARLVRYPNGLVPPVRLELASVPPHTVLSQLAIDWRDGAGNTLLRVQLHPDEHSLLLTSTLAGVFSSPVELNVGRRLTHDRGFSVAFDVSADGFRVALDGRHLCNFPHRVAPEMIAEVRSTRFFRVRESAVEAELTDARRRAGRGEEESARRILRGCLDRAPDHEGLQEAYADLLGISVARVMRDARSVSPLLARVSALSGWSPATIVERLFGHDGALVAVPVVPLGRSLAVRPGTTDLLVLLETFVLAHNAVPPGIQPQTILDLGANIGSTLALYATRFPQARIVGVELDDETAELARLNTATWRDRVTVVSGAVAPARGRVRYRRERGSEWTTAVAAGGDREVFAVTIDDLADRHFLGTAIDFLKMDIEGGEREILRRGGKWVARTRVISVEVHGDYTLLDARADLEGLGFSIEDEDEIVITARRRDAETDSSLVARVGRLPWRGRRA